MKIEEAIEFFKDFIETLKLNGENKVLNNYYCKASTKAIEALEKQIKPEEAKALQGSMMLVGQWISRETQARKYSTDEVMNISKALMDLKAHFDKLEVTE